MVEYRARFLMLKRFVLGSIVSERERRPVCVQFAHHSCLTLVEVVMRALACEHVNDSHHQGKGTTQTSGYWQRHRAQDQ